MSGSEGDRFVVEIQERVVMRLPLVMPAPLELERAGDPEVACVEADDLVAGVKDAPVARPRTPERDRLDITSWCYTITGRRHGVPSHLSIAKARLPRPDKPTAIKQVVFPSKDERGSEPRRIEATVTVSSPIPPIRRALGGLTLGIEGRIWP
jgi:hypothetical protein